MYVTVLSSAPCAEIIETYWNVNVFFVFFPLFSSSGNNRNILECKFWQFVTLGICSEEIIETYWNVNFLH